MLRKETAKTMISIEERNDTADKDSNVSSQHNESMIRPTSSRRSFYRQLYWLHDMTTYVVACIQRSSNSR